MIHILGIKIIDRIKEAGLTQEILSKYAGLITTRLGFHELNTEICSREAYIILHIQGNRDKINKLVEDLKSIGGIGLSEMTFDGDIQLVSQAQEGKIRVLGILVEKKNHEPVIAVQKTLTAYGCVIRTRLGLNEEFFGNPAGLIIVELVGDEDQMDLLEKDLRKIPEVQIRKMTF